MRTFSILVSFLLLAACAQPRYVTATREPLVPLGPPLTVRVVEVPPARASADRSPSVVVEDQELVATTTVSSIRITHTGEERLDEPPAQAPSAPATEHGDEPAPVYQPQPRQRSVWEQPETYMAIDAMIWTSIWLAFGHCH
jgi:hypothetical protein